MLESGKALLLRSTAEAVLKGRGSGASDTTNGIRSRHNVGGLLISCFRKRADQSVWAKELSSSEFPKPQDAVIKLQTAAKTYELSKTLQSSPTPCQLMFCKQDIPRYEALQRHCYALSGVIDS